MTVSEAKKKWRAAARCDRSGERFVLTGNMHLIGHELRWFAKDDDAAITVLAQGDFGQFSAVIQVAPNQDKKRVNPFLLLVG